MPLVASEWTLIRCLVRDHLVGTDNPYQTLRMYFPEHAPDWSITNVASANADMIVERAKQASLRDPLPFSIALLDVLCRLDAIRVKPDVVKVQEYLTRLRGEMEDLRLDNPYGVSVLTGTGRVFINRAPVRDSLRSLIIAPVQGPEPLALTVRGELGSGMSYTFYLIQHLAEPGSFRPARVILTPDATAADVLREFAVQIAPDAWPEPARFGQVEPADGVDPIKRLRYWALWLAQRGLSRDRPWWFVLDEWDRVDPNSDAVEFVLQLARAIADTTPPPGERRPRLALLGHRDDLPGLPLPIKQIRADAAKPASDAEVRAFFLNHFREIHRRQGGSPDGGEFIEELARIAAEQATTSAAEIARTSGVCYMSALSRAAEETIDVYTEQPFG